LVILSVLFNNPVALTSAFYSVKELASVPVRLYQSLVVTLTFKVSAHLKDKMPEGTN
jgi:hypothetical protein